MVPGGRWLARISRSVDHRMYCRCNLSLNKPAFMISACTDGEIVSIARSPCWFRPKPVTVPVFIHRSRSARSHTRTLVIPAISCNASAVARPPIPAHSAPLSAFLPIAMNSTALRGITDLHPQPRRRSCSQTRLQNWTCAQHCCFED
eukprot:2763826-Rhodomonas_salina.2